MLSEDMHNCTATVLQEGAICFIPRNDFMDLFKENAGFCKKMMSAVCREYGLMESKFAMMAQKSVKERLALNLLMLRESYGLDGGKSQIINIALSRETWPTWWAPPQKL